MTYFRLGVFALIAAFSTACSIKRIAVNKLGNALASGGSTYEADDDPDLVGDALPFGLKLMESLLAESPRHTGLLVAAASGFTEYSYAFVGRQAELAFTEDLQASNVLRARSRRLYLRAHAYAMRALEIRYPGFAAGLDAAPTAALGRVRKRDVALLYWTAAAYGLAVSASKDDPEMIAQLPLIESFVRRAMELDEGWNEGALPEFLINLEASHSGAKPEAEIRSRIQQYFEAALRLSGGRRASLFVTYAENLCIPAQNRAEFQRMLERALHINPDERRETRLATLMAQRRARWLLGRIDELFLDSSTTTEKEN